MTKKACADCASLVEQGKIWVCDEANDTPIEQIRWCPEGVESLDDSDETTYG